MRLARSVYFLLSCYILICNTMLVFAETTLSSRLLNQEHGLMSPIVECMLKDVDKSLWIGTQDGLYHYNGDIFKKFKPVRNDTNSLDNIWIHSLFQDNSGNLWIGTDGGLNVLLRTTGKIKRIKLSATEKETVKPFSILQDDKERIWVGTNTEGKIFVFNKNNFTKQLVKLPTDHLVSSLCLLKNGSVLAGTVDDGGIFLISSDLKKIKKIHPGNVSPFTNIKCMERGGGKIWVGSFYLGVGLFALEEDKLHTTFLNAQPIKGTENLLINALEYDKISNILWIGTYSGILYSYDPVNLELKEVNIGAKGIKNLEIKCLALETEEQSWLGTNNGLLQIRKNAVPFSKITDSISREGSMPVIALYVDKQGYYWYSQLDFKSAAKVKNNIHTNRPGMDAVLKKIRQMVVNDIFSIYEDGDELYFLSTNELFVLNLETNEFTRTFPNSLQSHLSEYLAFTKWKNNFLLATTRSGFIAVDSREKRSGKVNQKTILGNYGINGFTKYKDKWLLVWTTNGLYVLDENLNVVRRFPDELLSGKYVVGAQFDRNNFLWIAYYGDGVDMVADAEAFITTGRTPAIVNFNENCGLKTNACMGLQIDKYNLAWVSTTNGLYRISASNRLAEKAKYKNIRNIFLSDIDRGSFVKGYFKEDGLIDNDFSAFCATKSGNNNKLFFGSTRGVLMFNPEDVQINPLVNRVQITDFKIYEKDYPLDTAINEKKRIELNYNQKFLSFEFDLSFYNDLPNKSQFAFQMVGFDKDWIYSGNRRFARYTNLSPGDYLFRVKGTNEDGVWGKKIAYLHLTIKPPFWQTYWFYFLCLVVLLTTIFSLIRYREFRFRTENKLLEEKVQQRTQEIADINLTLTLKNRDITDSINYARRIQESILPKEIELKRYFPESFIMYKPKDIVSGDFYWIQKTLNETPEKFTIQLAVADCTGHGVPGALMSMIGVDKLNEAVANFISPGNILEYMNISVKTALRQSQSDEMQTRDGMDIALLAITMHKYSSHVMVEYAGANRPLWFFDSDGKLQEIKPSKVAIGGFTREEQTFHTHTFHMNKKQRLYLFTDGYADQFGGPKNHKYMIKRFRSKLIEMQHLSISEQSELLNRELREWQGENEQVDDILVIGIEL